MSDESTVNSSAHPTEDTTTPGFTSRPGSPAEGRSRLAVAKSVGALVTQRIALDGLITKFMGETAAKLRLVFDAMAATRGIYFFEG